MRPHKVTSVVGARPQFVKLGPVSRALRSRGIQERVIHTGQHFDDEMSGAFFRDLVLPKPDVNLGVAVTSPAGQVGAMLPALASALRVERPDLVIVFGDTSSTLAGALAAAYDGIPVAHVEAGMRSFNRSMPEEINRVTTDHLSSLLLTASAAAERNLCHEGLTGSVFTGDVMLDVVHAALEGAGRLPDGPTGVCRRFGVTPGQFVFATVHRAANTDSPQVLQRVLEILGALSLPVVFPAHPRTRAAIAAAGLHDRLGTNVHIVAPLPYLDTISLVSSAHRVFTDSGGLQKEAFYVGVPCTTLRDETEWVETVETGWNTLVGTDLERAVATLELPPPAGPEVFPYGDGHAGERTASAIERWLRTG